MADDVASEVQDEVAEEKQRLEMSVDIADAGPCRKHVKVTIPHDEVDKFFDKEYTDLVRNAQVAGFRPGKAPRKLVERRFREDVSGRVKGAILMQSLEQLGEDEKLDPLSEPELDVETIELPEEGDFVYEFEVEVRPTFDLPEYKNLTIKRPTKEFADDDVTEALTNLQKRHGALEAKAGGAEKGDYIDADIRFVTGDEVVREFDTLTIRVDEELTFRDGTISGFLKGIKGAKEGDSREFKVKLSDSVSRTDLAGSEIDAVFIVKEVKTLVPAELNEEFYAKFGVSDEGELRDQIRVMLERRLEHHQQESVKEQVLEKLLEKTDLDLPRDLLRRQSERALQRKVMDLQYAGYDDDQIRSRLNILRQDIQSTTATSLKQQFVLQAIAEAEEIKVEDEDLEAEIEQMARRSDESPRRVRARVEKDNLWDALGMQIQDRKTIEKIVSYGTLEDVPWNEEEIASSGLDESAIPEAELPAEEEGPAEESTE